MTTLSLSQYAASCGAAELDKKLPGWFELINTRALDISEGQALANGVPKCGCICAQLDAMYLKANPGALKARGRYGKREVCNRVLIVGEWQKTFKRLFKHPAWQAARFGFSTGYVVSDDGESGDTSFSELTAAWRKEISKRRRAAKQQAVAA